MYRHMLLIALVLVISAISISYCALLSGSSWPRMRNYDIWGSPDTVATKRRSANGSKLDQPEFNYQNLTGQSNGEKKSRMRNSKVLNFFPVLSDDECLSDDGRRSGVCLNVYECRIQGGSARGECALGFGVCCIFIASCDSEIANNITYIVSPNFPAVMARDIKSCKLKIKPMSEHISQLRFDFIHFQMGQPNRRTGICDGDLFSLRGGNGKDLTICGQNSGQHIYYDVDGMARQEGGVVPRIVDVVMNFNQRFFQPRMWEIRVTQIPFSQRAPAGCLQYFSGIEGLIQTFNFADNGRHLANQNYRACIRQETGMCSITYEPCDDQSFRIGPNNAFSPQMGIYMGMPGVGGFPGMVGGGGAGAGGGPGLAGAGSSPAGALADAPAAGGGGAPGLADGAGDGGAGGADVLGDDVADAGGGDGDGGEGDGGLLGDDGDVGGGADGAGDGGADGGGDAGDAGGDDVLSDDPGDAGGDNPADDAPANDDPGADDGDAGSGGGDPGFFSGFTSFFSRTFPDYDEDEKEDEDEEEDNEIFPFFNAEKKKNKGGKKSRKVRSLKTRVERESSPNSRTSKQFFSYCNDRITLPCIVEDFIATGMGSVPTCQPIHCGSSLCPVGQQPCRVETSVTPFALGIHFGDGLNKGSPEDNIGACLRYNQLPCL